MRKNEQVPYTCDWCGKTIMVSPSRAIRPTKFRACSDKCKHHLIGKSRKEFWEHLSPEEREETIFRTYGHRIGSAGEKFARGLIEYHRQQRPEKVQKVLAILRTPVKTRPNDRYLNKGGKENPRFDWEDPQHTFGTCVMITAHHEMMKDDPERLTTEFMQKMCRVDCRCKSKNVPEGEPEQ